MSDDNRSPQSKDLNTLKKAIIFAGALIGAVAGWYYQTASPLEGLFWGAILGAWAGAIIWQITEE